MNLKRRLLQYLSLFLFLPICLISCTPAAEINVACDIGDLIDAINDANANSDSTKLILDPNCTYTFTTKDNSDGGQGPNALPLITTKIIIEGNDATLDRSGTMFRFFFITGSGNLRLEDITIENGYALVISADQPSARGGAIYNDRGGLRAVRSSFRENQAGEGGGGAIYNLGILTLEDTHFELNIAGNEGNGGAIFSGGDMDIAAILQNVTFDTNIAFHHGGAIYNASGEAGFLISGSTFDKNHAFDHGGAIFSEAGDLNISNSEFLNNKAGTSSFPFGDGGAIYSLAGNLSLYGTQFSHHRAYGIGGILYAGPGTNVQLREVMSDDSITCHDGGALYLEGVTEILQTTLKDAKSISTIWNLDPWQYGGECFDHQGGAIYNTGNLILDSSLLESTYAMGEGDGIYNTGDLIFINSTFHDDVTYQYTRDAINNQGSAAVSFSTFMDSGLVNNGTMAVKASVITPSTNGCINSGTLNDLGENIALDPACPFSNILASFGNLEIESILSDNGGPTLTHLVRDNSPVIDTSDCLSVSGNQVINDQRGIYRPHPISGTQDCDAGAFELHYTTPPPPPPPLPPSPGCDPFEEDEEISLMMQSLPAETRIQVLYIKVEDGKIPGLDPEDLNGEPPSVYEANLGNIAAYQCGLQGFPDRLYCLFNIPLGMEGTVQLFEVRLKDCPDPFYSQPNVLIPMPNTPSSDQQPGPVCTLDLRFPDCEAAGGNMSFELQTGPRCVCP